MIEQQHFFSVLNFYYAKYISFSLLYGHRHLEKHKFTHTESINVVKTRC